MEKLDYEIWKDIPNYEGLYQASNLGNIKSLQHYNGIKITMREKILKPYKIRKYLGVKLSKNGIRKNCYIHRLILETFTINTYNKEQVNHINGNRYDNRLTNLEWCSGPENIKHSIQNKLHLKSQSTRAKKVNQYDLCGNFIKTWNSQTEAALAIQINPAQISMCCNKKIAKAGGYIWKFKQCKELEENNYG